MKDSTKKAILLGGIVVSILGFYGIKSLTDVVDFHQKYEGYDLTADVEGAKREGTYSKYLLSHQDAAYPSKTVDVDLFAYTKGEGVEVYTDYMETDKTLYTGDKSEVSWDIEVPEAGFYNIQLEYMTVESRGVPIEREIYINGELPFSEAENITFSRIWKDGGEVKVDNQGNEIRPVQVEQYDWQNAYCKDDMGFVTEPYRFYFEKGKNTISLKAVNEPMVLRKLSVTSVNEKINYEQYLAKQNGAKATGEGLTWEHVIQGEDSTLRSEPSLYAKYDRASPTTQPYSVTQTILNYAGGEAWSSAGQWIEWNFEVPEDGYYNITIKGRQNYDRGSASVRSVSIDGVTPFEELEKVYFDYSNDWKTLTLSDDAGQPYDIWLKKGTHTIRMEASLGDLGDILAEMEDSTFRLNQVYRKLLVYTGANPDKFRDYNIDKVYPEVIEAMSLEARRLYKMVDELVAYTGQKSDKIASAQTLAQQLERFVERPEKITIEFLNFKDNVTALGTAMLNMRESKLDVDYLVVSGTEANVPHDKAGVLAHAWHEIKSFAASFVVDYDAVGDVYDADESGVVKVWVLTGRDQGTILKTMIDDTFSPMSGVKVNVEIVDQGALLNAVIAGRGPNVVLSVGGGEPVNYALRGASEDLTQFEDLEEVLGAFSESSYEQYRLEDGIYAIPETQQFNVMFYREDILEEMGLEIPQTWQELIEMLPTIQGNNMSVGIPSAAKSTGAELSVYYTLLFQAGGSLYNEAGTKTAVNEEAGVEAISAYTKYFTDYGIPKDFDFVSRFRSGEMPIGVAGYPTYNTLVVSAPEIRGLWDFTLIPGTMKKDAKGKEYIDRSEVTSGAATMMIRTEDEAVKQNAWEFMKWWASADTQVRFGRELEALLGSSARYATANIDAFERLSWSADDIEVLTEQRNQTVGIPSIPGGYYTDRHLVNAIRKVVNESVDPRETIVDYAITIDEEITKKRTEFGMPVE